MIEGRRGVRAAMEDDLTGTEPRPPDDGSTQAAARLILGVIVAIAMTIIGWQVIQDRPWVGERERIDRCADLRHARDLALQRVGDPDGNFTRTEAKAFCRLDAANENLNHRGGLRRL